MSRVVCDISGLEVDADDARSASELSTELLKLIQVDHPQFDCSSVASVEALRPYRTKYLTNIIQDEIGEINRLENEVVDAISHNKILSENIEETIDEGATIGQRMADTIAEFGGSWTFIAFFFTFILVWMILNLWALYKLSGHTAFDPFPFILLNLILSCLAAIQAPIIMMSQNRMEQKDRVRNEHDYKVNLKAELEIRMLHDKIDHVLIHQNRHIMEVLRVQDDYLEEIQRMTSPKVDKSS